jgi:ribonuclease P protein component
MTNTFGKQYILKSKKRIEEVHSKGSTLKNYPFVAKLLPVLEEESTLQFAIAVPKRLHKKACTRNLIRRRIKEAIRTNKSELEMTLQKNAKRLAIFVIYTSPDILEYQLIEKKVKQLFTKV